MRETLFIPYIKRSVVQYVCLSLVSDFGVISHCHFIFFIKDKLFQFLTEFDSYNKSTNKMVLFCKSISASAFLTAFACCLCFVSITGSPVDSSPSLEGDDNSRMGKAKAAGLNTELLEKVNVDKYLKNERAVRQQLKCILRNGPCDSIGNNLLLVMIYFLSPCFARVLNDP